MTRSRSNDLVRAATDLVVLSVLNEGQMYGYMIIKQVAARSDGAIRLTPSVLYPLLHQLEKQGFLLASWEEVRAEGNNEDGTGRKRKWYRLSAKGRRRLAQRATAHRAYQALIESFLPEVGEESVS